MDDDLVRVVGYPTIEAANATARELVLHGIGATVGGPDPSAVLSGAPPGGPAGGPGAELVGETGATEPYSVLVVATERMRARELLGLVEDRESELSQVERARSSAPSLKILIPVLLAAFVLIPVIAFYVSFKASGG